MRAFIHVCMSGYMCEHVYMQVSLLVCAHVLAYRDLKLVLRSTLVTLLRTQKAVCTLDPELTELSLGSLFRDSLSTGELLPPASSMAFGDPSSDPHTVR